MMYCGIAPSQLQIITSSPAFAFSGVYSHVRIPMCSKPGNRGCFLFGSSRQVVRPVIMSYKVDGYRFVFLWLFDPSIRLWLLLEPVW